MRTRAAALFGFATVAALVTGDWENTRACRKPWVFFDLGNTVVTHRAGEPSTYAPGAREYIDQLKNRGYRIGLITNVPAEWGPTPQAKLRELKKVIAETWTRDPAAHQMNWQEFRPEFTFMPSQEKERKPAPYLFRSALSRVSLEEGKRGCKVVFQGEDPREVEAARQEGMVAYLVGVNPAAPFLSIDELERLAR